MPRNQSQTATFTLTQPRNAESQWNNLWTHDFKVDVNPCDNTFSGTGKVYDTKGEDSFTADESITGTFGDNGSISFTATRTDGLVFSGVNVNANDVTLGTVEGGSPWLLELKATRPVITNISTFKNHGEFVKKSDSKNDAAHSCIGMPINSSK